MISREERLEINARNSVCVTDIHIYTYIYIYIYFLYKYTYTVMKLFVYRKVL